jgi:hypothetical protein
MLRRLLFALVMLAAMPISNAVAQCDRIGEEVCQGGFLYRCEACGSEKCLVITGEQCRAPADSLAGTWSGSGHQSGGGFESSDYPVVMTIDQSGASIDYPSLKCGGSLVELANSGTSAKYREQITYGKCLDGGMISVTLAGNRLAWNWSGSGGVTVTALLERTGR